MMKSVNGVRTSTDFLRRPLKRRRKGLRWALGILGGFVVVLGGLFLYYRTPALALYRNAIWGKERFVQAQAAALAQEYRASSDHLDASIDHFQKALDGLEELGGLRLIPGLNRQLSAVENLLRVGLEAGGAAKSLSGVAERITAPIQSDGPVSFADITIEQKRDVLSLMTTVEPELQGAKAEIDLAVFYLDQIPEGGLLGPIAKGAAELREQLPQIQEALTQALPAAQALPAIVGYPKGRSYLFLLQNNSELRPTGGFIGTYGLLTLKDGEIVTFTTDNIYNLDDGAKETLDIEPPEPLQRYLNATQWFMRDANWSPDFPTAARRVLEFYDLERGAKQRLDGVIAVTPTFIASLLELTGEIAVGGYTFTAENLVDTLEYEVQQGFLRKDIPLSERKEIIGALAQLLSERLLALPQNKWPQLFEILSQQTEERQILMYLQSDDEQDLVAQLGWSGEVAQTDGDYLMVVDANLASLKTDPVVDRAIAYTVTKDADGLLADVRIRYTHTGEFNWKTTRYRTYTRILVPEGSTLVSHEGYMTNDKTKGGRAGEPDVVDELGKTVIGGFISIEPQETGELHIQYRLPARIAEAATGGSYTLAVQKQPGTPSHGLTLDVTLPGKIQSHSPEEGATVDNGRYRLNTDLLSDRFVSLTLKP